MTPTTSHWQRIKLVFNEVADLEPAARTAALGRLCADDTELIREVESLLRADDRASGFIGAPALVQSTPAPKTIGPFRVIREIGRGGMGVVYLAEREGEFAQRVAIKVISAGLVHADHVLRRFRAEREILARLEHPNVARLLDGGTTPDGLPYFVMEHVEGTPIDRYCRERNLPLRARLELFLGVCSAVQYAHQNLVIHRDLKPANILITDDGTPKLLDFGIAKVVDESSSGDHTATELRAMTPEYASPEQILGLPLATSSDVYSLGVVLFELLTDEKLHRFTSSAPGELARAVLNTEPDRPSTVAARRSGLTARALRGDLDNIVQMALRKEPARRYASAQALADDVRRHLDGLPVSARPDTIGYRAAKFVARNRVAVGASLLLLLALIGGIATTSWQAVAARREQQKAERRFGQLRKLARSLIYDIDNELVSISGAVAAREKLVRTALIYLDSLAAEADDPELQLEVALAYQRIGEVQGNSYQVNLGQTAAARSSYAKSRRILEALAARQPRDRDTLQALARAYMGTGDIEYGGNELKAAARWYERSASTWNRLAAIAPLDLAQTRSFTMLLTRQGDVLGMPGYSNLGRLADATAAHRRALAIREELLRKHPQNERVARDVAESLTKVGYLANAAGDYAGAAAMNQRAADLMATIAAKNPHSANDQHDLAFTLMSASFALREVGRFDEGIRTLERSREVTERLAAGDPSSVTYRRNLSVINNHLSAILTDAGRPAEALQASTRAINLAEHLWAGNEENSDAALDYVIAVRRGTEASLALGQYDAVLQRGRVVSTAEELARGGNQRARFEQALLEARLGLAASRTGRPAEARRRLELARGILLAQVSAGSADVRTRDELALTHLYLAEALDRQASGSGCASHQSALGLWDEMVAANNLPYRSRRSLETARAAVAACSRR